MNTYSADVKLAGSSIRQPVSIQARDISAARRMLESQYGTGSVANLHQTSK